MIEKIQLALDIIGTTIIFVLSVVILLSYFGFKKSFVSQLEDNTERIDKLENRVSNIEDEN